MNKVMMAPKSVINELKKRRPGIFQFNVRGPYSKTDESVGYTVYNDDSKETCSEDLIAFNHDGALILSAVDCALKNFSVKSYNQMYKDKLGSVPSGPNEGYEGMEAIVLVFPKKFVKRNPVAAEEVAFKLLYRCLDECIDVIIQMDKEPDVSEEVISHFIKRMETEDSVEDD